MTTAPATGPPEASSRTRCSEETNRQFRRRAAASHRSCLRFVRTCLHADAYRLLVSDAPCSAKSPLGLPARTAVRGLGQLRSGRVALAGDSAAQRFTHLIKLARLAHHI